MSGGVSQAATSDFFKCLIACLSTLLDVDVLGLPTDHKARYIFAVFHSFTIALVKGPSTAMPCRQPGVADQRSVF